MRVNLKNQCAKHYGELLMLTVDPFCSYSFPHTPGKFFPVPWKQFSPDPWHRYEYQNGSRVCQHLHGTH